MAQRINSHIRRSLESKTILQAAVLRDFDFDPQYIFSQNGVRYVLPRFVKEKSSNGRALWLDWHAINGQRKTATQRIMGSV